MCDPNSHTARNTVLLTAEAADTLLTVHLYIRYAYKTCRHLQAYTMKNYTQIRNIRACMQLDVWLGNMPQLVYPK